MTNRKIVVENRKARHEYELYDPFNIEELVNKKLDEINLFEEQIHFALTQANCTNTIEVEFED